MLIMHLRMKNEGHKEWKKGIAAKATATRIKPMTSGIFLPMASKISPSMNDSKKTMTSDNEAMVPRSYPNCF